MHQFTNDPDFQRKLWLCVKHSLLMILLLALRVNWCMMFIGAMQA